MTRWHLPTSVEINGRTWGFRSDFRDVLELIRTMNDPEIPDDERGIACLAKFYTEAEEMGPAEWQDASNYIGWFVNCGDDGTATRRRRVMDWEQDGDMIASAVNRVVGYECRSCEYMHWWTFMGAYMEIGDCLFAQVVAIRDKMARGKKLEKHEREFYARNKAVVDLKARPQKALMDIVEEWLG